jgi:adenylate cyclase class IV
VGSNFDFKAFRAKLELKNPQKSYDVVVEDRYFFSSENPTFVYRHRRDKILNQLTYKNIGTDAEQRTEINLDLDKNVASESVEAFISKIGKFKNKIIKKNVSVFYYEDVEIVYYSATDGAQRFYCVEFEVRDFETRQKSLDILIKHERELGFNSKDRCEKSLLELFSGK